jgi:hypothetical protein
MNRFLDASNLLWKGYEKTNFFDNFFPKKINGTHISYIISYMTCEYKHNEIKPLLPNQNINLEELNSHAYINSSTTKFRTFLA